MFLFCIVLQALFCKKNFFLCLTWVIKTRLIFSNHGKRNKGATYNFFWLISHFYFHGHPRCLLYSAPLLPSSFLSPILSFCPKLARYKLSSTHFKTYITNLLLTDICFQMFTITNNATI